MGVYENLLYARKTNPVEGKFFYCIFISVEAGVLISYVNILCCLSLLSVTFFSLL